jgi:hypothetical protein
MCRASTGAGQITCPALELTVIVDSGVSDAYGDRMSTTIEDRQVRRRLAILRHAEEVTGNVAMTCRYYGISRQNFYVWKRRYDELGPDRLKDRPAPRPHMWT